MVIYHREKHTKERVPAKMNYAALSFQMYKELLLKYIILLLSSFRTRARGNVARAHARAWGYSFNIYLSIIYALRS